MPELNDVVGTMPATTAVEQLPVAASASPVIDATVITKPKKKAPVKKEKKEVSDSSPVPEASPTEPKKDLFIRPPMEQIARDIERLILDKKIGEHEIKKLPYKCGKIIFGLTGAGKDFRVIALKARKKSKSVAGKSRCIYYFGINEDHSSLLKEIPGIKTSKFGCCSVQSKKPIELILDKTTYKEIFNTNPDAVVATVSRLIDITVEQKNKQFEALTETTAAKAEATKKKEAKKVKKVPVAAD
jgi:hypothetical protein